MTCGLLTCGLRNHYLKKKNWARVNLYEISDKKTCYDTTICKEKHCLENHLRSLSLGTCWVMQCMEPWPHTRSLHGIPLMLLSGNNRRNSFRIWSS